MSNTAISWDVETEGWWIFGTGVINTALHRHRLSHLPVSKDHNIWLFCPLFTKQMRKYMKINIIHLNFLLFIKSLWQLTQYCNCYSCIKESVGAFPNILWIHPGVDLLTMVICIHWVDLKTAVFGICPVSACFVSKYPNDIIWIPAVINQRIWVAVILVPNYTVWSLWWIPIVVKFARDDKAGTLHPFDPAWHLYIPSCGTVENISYKRTIMQREK